MVQKGEPIFMGGLKPSRHHDVKSIRVHLRFNKKLQTAVQGLPVERLNATPQFGKMALQMKFGQGKRYQQFSRDTATTVHLTRNSIVSLWRSWTLTRSWRAIVRVVFRTLTEMELFLT